MMRSAQAIRRSRPARFAAASVALLLAATLAACGKKGALYLPDQQPAKPATGQQNGQR